MKFVVLTFGLSAPFWILGAVVKTPESAPIPLPLSALQFVTPLVAASILVYRADGYRGVRRLLRRLGDRGQARSWRKYALIVLVMPLTYAMGYLVMRASGRDLPDPAISLESILVLAVLFTVTAAFEEVGWTAYALDPLQDRWGMARAALALGLTWALFHLVADIQGEHDLAWMFLHRTSATALRVLIVCAYNVTGKGVLAAVLLHASDNVSWQLFPEGGATYDPAFIAPITVAIAVIGLAWTTRIMSRQGSGVGSVSRRQPS